ncbi:hypothetical protein IL306_003360, partial [Fusarium sp. DS 682]
MDFDLLDAPVPGAQTGSSAIRSTTGEVNLYLDPTTFGTITPMFYADCEGLLGTEPLAAEHQTEWARYGKRYLIESKDGKLVDRRTAVKTIYPRFLYIFSDVICYVTRNHRAWADSALRLLDWSKVGVQNTINQHALPALIIVLNGPTLENEEWLGDDHEVVTDAFFQAIEKEISETTEFRELAQKVVHYAFAHLASGSPEPFDFGQCRRQISVPDTTEGHFSEFLGMSLKNDMETRFNDTAGVIATSLLRNSLSANKDDIVLLPSVVLDKETQAICTRAISQFLDSKSPCAYIDPDSGEKCVNTKSGHRIGHQSASGDLLHDGNFVSGDFNPEKFLHSIEAALHTTMRAINASGPANHFGWRRLAAVHHRKNVDALRQHGGYPASRDKGSLFPSNFGKETSLFGLARSYLSIYTGLLCGNHDPSTTFCLGCLFGRPEYKLPCGHVICKTCVEDFDDTDSDKRYPGRFMHQRCIICDNSSSDKWPYTAAIRPPLSGLRVLSLDGGGVRGIVELTVLNRLEKEIGLGLPIENFFDLIVGTSTGDSIYKTDILENALQNAFEGKDPKSLYGLNSSCRIAVTTTAKEDCHLIANYNPGGKDRYLDSTLPLWKAARCTSAAPMYFEHISHAGHECRDGGLKENNPIQVALNESRKIWEDANYDVILSVGSGHARYPAAEPVSTAIIPKWLAHLFSTLVSTMNGEDAWDRFLRSQDKRIRDRASRLNLRFDGSTEHALDDTNAIASMEAAAKKTTFYERVSVSPFSATSGIVEGDALQCMADKLRASLYFFELASITKHGAVTVIHGWICCRLMPDEQGFKELLAYTSKFIVRGKVYEVKQVPEDKPLRLAIEFQHQHLEEPIRIDANFGATHSATISGLSSPPSAGESRSFDGQPAAELPAIPKEPTRIQIRIQHTGYYLSLKSQLQNLIPSQQKPIPTRWENLVAAAKNNDSVKVVELLDQNVPINGKHGGWTALGYAAYNGQLYTVQTLLLHGADLDIRMDVGFGVLPGDGSAINWAANGGYLDVVKLLLESGAKANICAKRPVFLGTGGTPITMAAAKGHLEIVRFLLEKGCDNDSSEVRPGWDAFFVACERGQLNIMKYFLEEKGFSVHWSSKDGTTPLIVAAQNQQPTVMEYLVKCGARIDAVDNDSSTALLHAAVKKR